MITSKSLRGRREVMSVMLRVSFFIVFGLSVIFLVSCGNSTGSTESLSNQEEVGSSSAAPESAELNTVESIIEAGKEEGELIWYAGMNAGQMNQIAEQFMEAYPEIRVEAIALGPDEASARMITEYRANRHNVDIISTGSWSFDQVKREELIQPFRLPDDVTATLGEGTYDEEGFWLSQYALTYPISFNTQKLMEAGLEAPDSYEDFTQPEWKGKFAVDPNYNFEWYSALKQALGDEEAKDLLQRLAANDPLFRDLGTMPDLLEAGEFVATLHAFGYNIDMRKKNGGSVDYVNPVPTISILQPSGIALHAPHPNAAKVFQLWMASAEAQQFLNDVLNRTSTHKGINNNFEVWDPSRFEYFISDPNEGGDYEAIRKEYQQFFGIGG